MRTFFSLVIGALVALALVAVATALPRVIRADARGSSVVRCAYSHTLNDDPILAPLPPGGSHAHDFVGNVETSAQITHGTSWVRRQRVATVTTPPPCGRRR